MTDFKVIIAGCRDFSDYDLLKSKCNYYLQKKTSQYNIVVISGHASGADALGERFAKEHNYKVELHSANWEKHGKAAGPIRNSEMADIADALIAFWDGKSRGTKSMIELAKKKGLQVAVVRFDN